MKPPYYLTAYGIACKHGFKGTEEEWLNSLTAFYLAQQAGYGGTVDEWLRILNDPVPEIQIGEVETLEGGSAATVIISGDKYHPILNFGIPRGMGMADALPLVGGKMKGSINMNGHAITNLPDPENEGDAVPKRAVLLVVGGKMAGVIDMDSHKITNLAEPTAAKDAVTRNYADKIKKTADSAVQPSGGTMTGPLAVLTPTADAHAANKAYVDTKKKPATLTASNWSSSAPYTQSITVEGLSDGVNARAYPSWPEALADKLALGEETVKVRSCERSGSTMTFQCWEDKPVLDIPIIVEVYV